MEEYTEAKDFVENRKPYWLYVDVPRDGEMRYSLFNYFPAAHYKEAIDQAFENLVREKLESDGGTRTYSRDDC